MFIFSFLSRVAWADASKALRAARGSECGCGSFLSRHPTALAVTIPAVPGHPAPLQQPAALRHCAVRARQSRNDGAAAPPPDRPDGRRGRVRRRRLLGRDLQLHQGRRDAARSSVQRVAARRERHVHGDDADLEEGRRRLRWHGQQGRRRVPLHLRQLRLLQRLLRRADALEHDEDELGLGDVGQRRRPQPRRQPHADDSPDQPHRLAGPADGPQGQSVLGACPPERCFPR